MPRIAWPPDVPHKEGKRVKNPSKTTSKRGILGSGVLVLIMLGSTIAMLASPAAAASDDNVQIVSSASVVVSDTTVTDPQAEDGYVNEPSACDIANAPTMKFNPDTQLVLSYGNQGVSEFGYPYTGWSASDGSNPYNIIGKSIRQIYGSLSDLGSYAYGSWFLDNGSRVLRAAVCVREYSYANSTYTTVREYWERSGANDLSKLGMFAKTASRDYFVGNSFPMWDPVNQLSATSMSFLLVVPKPGT